MQTVQMRQPGWESSEAWRGFLCLSVITSLQIPSSERIFSRDRGLIHSVTHCVFWARFPCRRFILRPTGLRKYPPVSTNKTDASHNPRAMGAKQKAGSSKPKGNQTEEVEETLQAVVLADTFETRFEPFTLDRPRVRCVDRGVLR